MAVSADLESFPLVYFRFSGETTVEDARWMMEQQEQLARRAMEEGIRFFGISDSLETTKASPAVRKYLAETAKASSELFEQAMGPYVILARSLVVRGAITAVGWMVPSLMRGAKAARDFDEAVVIMREWAEANGEVFPEDKAASLRSRLKPPAVAAS